MAAFSMLGLSFGQAEDSTNSYSTTVTNGVTPPGKPDNTERNVRDRDGSSLTPGDQGKSESDREITRNTRRAINSNNQLSTLAKNVKVITVDGKVTLRGPVNSEQEKETIASLAKQAGAASVDNQLEAKTTNQ